MEARASGGRLSSSLLKRPTIRAAVCSVARSIPAPRTCSRDKHHFQKKLTLTKHAQLVVDEQMSKAAPENIRLSK